MIETTIVIVTRNREKLLKKCLDSIKLDKLSGYEIVVVDNASSDSTIKMLSGYGGVKLIKNKKNIGVAAARNKGALKAKGNILIFLDDDAFLKKGADFQQIIRYLKKNKKAALAGPKILYPSGKIQESARSFPTPLAVIWRGTFLHKLFPNTSFYKNYILKDADLSYAQVVDWVMGACQIIDKNIFIKVGKYSEKYFFGWEDIEFCYRLKKMGFKVIYFPHVEVIHYYQRESAKGFMSKPKLEHLKSIFRFFCDIR